MTPGSGKKKNNKSVVSTQLIANTLDLTNIKHHCVVNKGSQLPLNLSVCRLGIFFSLDTHSRTRTNTKIWSYFMFALDEQ